MVKTRHCVEVDGDSPNRFLSLETRGSKPLNDISRDVSVTEISGSLHLLRRLTEVNGFCLESLTILTSNLYKKMLHELETLIRILG